MPSLLVVFKSTFSISFKCHGCPIVSVFFTLLKNMSTWLYEARRAANPAPEESEDSDAAVGNDADDDEQSTQELGN